MRKLLSKAIAFSVLSFTVFQPLAYASIGVDTLPVLDNATNANVSANGNNMNIQINGGQGGVGSLNWESFNVGKDAGVNFEFTDHNQTALNKVSATGGLSQIYGKITSSGCFGCGYDASGKVILINPNGVLFGDGANVNLNSFTVSTLDGTFNPTTNTMEFVKNSPSEYGIIVQDGAKIYGDKAINFISDQVKLYNGSKLSTNVDVNYGTNALGKVKIVTADGVNFTYYNNGAVKNISNEKVAADKMMIYLNGEITSGNIDARNLSQNTGSEININGGTLKATKAVAGNDGNIWLTANNDIIIDSAKIDTVNISNQAASRNGGNLKIQGNGNVSLKNSNVNIVGDANLTSLTKNSIVDSSVVNSAKAVNVNAEKVASVQNSTKLTAKNITVSAKERSQAVQSNLNADETLSITSPSLVWTESANLKANDVNLNANNGYVLLNNSIIEALNNISVSSKDSVTSTKLAGSTFNAGNNINLTSSADSVLLNSTDQFKATKTLNLNGAKNVEINTDGALNTKNINITAGENIHLTSANESVNVDSSTKFNSGKKLYIIAKKDVKTTGTVDTNKIQTNIKAENDVNVTLANVDDRNNGIIANAGKDMTITTDGTLSVSSLISGNDMTINADKVIAGLPYTTNKKLPEDLVSERSYIEVGGKFTSNTKNDSYVVTASGDLTNDGKYKQRHHIQYGNGAEKILLVNKRKVDNHITAPVLPDIPKGEGVEAVAPGQVNEPMQPSVPPTINPENQNGNQGNNQGGSQSGNQSGNQGSVDCDAVQKPDNITDETQPEVQSSKLQSKTMQVNIQNYAASATTNSNSSSNKR